MIFLFRAYLALLLAGLWNFSGVCWAQEGKGSILDPWEQINLTVLNGAEDEVLIGWDGQELYFGRLNARARLDSGDRWFLAERSDFTAQRTLGWAEFDAPHPTRLTANRHAEWDGLGVIQHISVDDERGVMVMSVWMLNDQLDLFIAHETDEGWSIPQPLDALNTSAHEAFPNFHQGDLLFGSNRPGGLGGFDVYRAKRLDMYSRCQPLPQPINSKGDELSALPAGDSQDAGYYVSAVRMAGQGGVDVWWMGPAPLRLEPSRFLGMEVMHHRAPLRDLEVRIRQRGGPHLFSGQLDAAGRVILGSLVLDASVEVRFEPLTRKRDLPEGAVCHLYEQCASGGCLSEKWSGWRRIRSYRLEGGTAFVFDLLPLDILEDWIPPVADDRSSLLQQGLLWESHFLSNRSDLSSTDLSNLRMWLRALWDFESPWYIQSNLEVWGYTDAAGSPELNEQLARDRAAQVISALISWGVPAANVTLHSEPSSSLEVRSDDRRVEVHWHWAE